MKRPEKVSGQLGPKVGRPKSGISAAARDVGIPETEAKRAVKVASLSDEAKDAARETGLDGNGKARRCPRCISGVVCSFPRA